MSDSSVYTLNLVRRVIRVRGPLPKSEPLLMKLSRQPLDPYLHRCFYDRARYGASAEVCCNHFVLYKAVGRNFDGEVEAIRIYCFESIKRLEELF
ncbi:hypothetical protein TNCT_228511 [Trichonephila clavata]|uniref:Uncharacterized protein n=1 Tax=Trichonephila clavata TaxID=2740835 RepID=A0A8X6LDX0_TRICU|nr:hypothetical protein TNCT_228511 [Trichonephila clavata]